MATDEPNITHGSFCNPSLIRRVVASHDNCSGLASYMFTLCTTVRCGCEPSHLYSTDLHPLVLHVPVHPARPTPSQWRGPRHCSDGIPPLPTKAVNLVLSFALVAGYRLVLPLPPFSTAYHFPISVPNLPCPSDSLCTSGPTPLGDVDIQMKSENSPIETRLGLIIGNQLGKASEKCEAAVPSPQPPRAPRERHRHPLRLACLRPRHIISKSPVSHDYG